MLRRDPASLQWREWDPLLCPAMPSHGGLYEALELHMQAVTCQCSMQHYATCSAVHSLIQVKLTAIQSDAAQLCGCSHAF